jgi:hypothetical protein
VDLMAGATVRPPLRREDRRPGSLSLPAALAGGRSVHRNHQPDRQIGVQQQLGEDGRPVHASPQPHVNLKPTEHVRADDDRQREKARRPQPRRAPEAAALADPAQEEASGEQHGDSDGRDVKMPGHAGDGRLGPEGQ